MCHCLLCLCFNKSWFKTTCTLSWCRLWSVNIPEFASMSKVEDIRLRIIMMLLFVWQSGTGTRQRDTGDINSDNCTQQRNNTTTPHQIPPGMKSLEGQGTPGSNGTRYNNMYIVRMYAYVYRCIILVMYIMWEQKSYGTSRRASWEKLWRRKKITNCHINGACQGVIY